MKYIKGREKFFTSENEIEGHEGLYVAKVMDSTGQYRLYIYTKTNYNRRTVKVKNIETGVIFESMTAAAKLIGIPSSAISEMCHGKRPFGYNGYHFETVQEDDNNE